MYGVDCSGEGQVAGSSEYGNDPSRYIKWKEVLEKVSDH